MNQMLIKKKIKTKLVFFIFVLSILLPQISEAIGRKYAPEEGTFDRRKRIVIKNKCRLVKEKIVPGDVVCEYRSQKFGEKNKQIFLGAPGNTCQKEITCPIK